MSSQELLESWQLFVEEEEVVESAVANKQPQYTVVAW